MLVHIFSYDPAAIHPYISHICVSSSNVDAYASLMVSKWVHIRNHLILVYSVWINDLQRIPTLTEKERSVMAAANVSFCYLDTILVSFMLKGYKKIRISS